MVVVKGATLGVRALQGFIRTAPLPTALVLSNATLQGSLEFSAEPPVIEVEGGRFEINPDYANVATAGVVAAGISLAGLRYAQKKIQFANRLAVITECLDLIEEKFNNLTTYAMRRGRGLQLTSPIDRIEDAVRTLKTAEDPAVLGLAQIQLNDAMKQLSDEAAQLGALFDAVIYANNPATAGLSLPAGVEEGLRKLPVGVRIEAPLLNELINNPNKFAVSSADKDIIQDIAAFFYKDSFYSLDGISRKAFNIRNELSQIKTGAFAFVDESVEVLDTVIPNVKIELQPLAKNIREGKIGKDIAQFTTDMSVATGLGQQAIADAKNVVRKARYAKVIRVLGIVDLAIWGATGVVDVLLDWAGIDEEDQRIPWIADIPVIGRLFDLSTGFGTSLTDAFVVDPLLSLVPQEAVEGFSDILGQDFSSFQLLLIAVLDWAIEDIGFTGNIQLVFGSREPTVIQAALPVPPLEPLDVLAGFAVACVAKIVFKAWVVPAWRVFTTTAGLDASPA